MVALYREADIAPRLVRRLGLLDYPRDLLDILLVVEEEDHLTRNALALADLPGWMRIIVVPGERLLFGLFNAIGETLPSMVLARQAVALAAGRSRAAVAEAAESLYRELNAAGVETVLDDRGLRPGAMFADMELIGIPHRIVVSERGLAAGHRASAAQVTGRRLGHPQPVIA